MELGAIFPEGNVWSLHQLWGLLYFAIAVYVGVLLLTLFGGKGPLR